MIGLKRRQRVPLDYVGRGSLRAVFIVTAIFLYAPIFILIAFSFSESRRLVAIRGFTFRWYERAMDNEQLLLAFANSLTIALVNTLVATALGALAALLLWRFRFPLKAGYEGAITLPIVVPEICMGVALYAFFARIGWPSDWFWPFNLSAITAAHIAFSFPFVTMIVRARLAGFNRELEESARDLGASEWQVLRDIIIPFMRPGLIAGALLAFTLSLDDFVITFFTSGPNTITFPIKIYSMVRFSVTPEVNAASTVLIVITLFLTAFALWVQNRANKSDATR
ncbi:MAG: ABC transporter permease [Pseudomonadota bacterium]